MAMTLPFRALFLTDAVHATPALVTVFLLVVPIAGVLASSLLGRVSDRFPVRRLLILGTSAAGAAGCGISAIVRNYWVLLLVTATAIALSTALLPQLFAYARTAFGRGERAAMTTSMLRTMLSVSWVAGPFVAALLIDAGGFTLIFGVSTLIYLAAGLVAAFGLPEPRPAPAHDPDAPTGADQSGRVVWVSVVALILVQAAATFAVQALPLFVAHDLHGDVRDTGLLLGLCALLEVPLILGFGVLASRLGVRTLFLAGPVVSFAYFATVAISTGTGQVAVAQVLNAAGIALLGGIGITYFQDLLPSQPGRASTLFNNAFPIGSTLAAPLLGLSQQVGYRVGYAVCAVLCVAGLGLLLAMRPTSVSPRAAVPVT
ncbi:MFS transporter [Cryptosporangium phraense]|uniref:MFS transporter n=2 Tax=Cryptosporangium phraense TaxID=2593070 RepID=A0A545ASA6_9ACTN|nr:MFS transporter [Cryptosporangium phraense]